MARPGLVDCRRQPGPGSQMGGGREPGHFPLRRTSRTRCLTKRSDRTNLPRETALLLLGIALWLVVRFCGFWQRTSPLPAPPIVSDSTSCSGQEVGWLGHCHQMAAV
jgi:hypothetical protein